MIKKPLAAALLLAAVAPSVCAYQLELGASARSFEYDINFGGSLNNAALRNLDVSRSDQNMLMTVYFEDVEAHGLPRRLSHLRSDSSSLHILLGRGDYSSDRAYRAGNGDNFSYSREQDFDGNGARFELGLIGPLRLFLFTSSNSFETSESYFDSAPTSAAIAGITAGIHDDEQRVSGFGYRLMLGDSHIISHSFSQEQYTSSPDASIDASISSGFEQETVAMSLSYQALGQADSDVFHSEIRLDLMDVEQQATISSFSFMGSIYTSETLSFGFGVQLQQMTPETDAPRERLYFMERVSNQADYGMRSVMIRDPIQVGDNFANAGTSHNRFEGDYLSRVIMLRMSWDPSDRFGFYASGWGGRATSNDGELALDTMQVELGVNLRLQ